MQCSCVGIFFLSDYFRFFDTFTCVPEHNNVILRVNYKVWSIPDLHWIVNVSQEWQLERCPWEWLEAVLEKNRGHLKYVWSWPSMQNPPLKLCSICLLTLHEIFSGLFYELLKKNKLSSQTQNPPIQSNHCSFWTNTVIFTWSILLHNLQISYHMGLAAL